jgi:hypothetical protein
VALLVLAAFELYLERSLAKVAPPPAEAPAAGVPESSSTPGFHVLSREDPVAWFRGLVRELRSRPVVFVGDSQGRAALAGGAPYPEQVARRLQLEDPSSEVITLHMGGANTYEQATLMLAMLDAGIRPRLVVWSHSIFSLRKNQIRRELAGTYATVAVTMDTLAASVTVAGGGEAVDAVPVEPDPARVAVASLGARWGAVLERSASVSFMRRTLWDKGQILRRSPLGSLIPTSLLGGTARQFDPPASILRDATRVVGELSSILVAQEACVIDFVAPVNRSARPRPFSERAEAVSYPALGEASRRAGAVFADLLDAMPPDHFGTYEDGTPDAFHFDAAGHALLADRLMNLVAERCEADGR